MNDKRTGGLILAAGRSSRMGGFKPLLPLGESTVLLSGLEKLRSCCDDIAVVTGRNSEQIKQVLESYPYAAAIYNKDYETAPMFSSVMLGVEYLMGRCERMFILPCDVPAFREHTLFAMLKLMDDADAKAVRPAFCGRPGHPVLIGSAAFESILCYGGERGLAGAIESVGGAAEAFVPDRGILLDADDPQDYERLLEYYAKREVPDKDECEAVLEFMHVPEGIRAHGRAVAERAALIARALSSAGVVLDSGLVYAAGLLHDICRIEAKHAERGAAELGKMGFDKTARIVSEHMELKDPQKLNEAAVVYYADKTTEGERYVTLNERERGVIKRFSDNEQAREAALQRIASAKAVERKILGICPMAF